MKSSGKALPAISILALSLLTIVLAPVMMPQLSTTTIKVEPALIEFGSPIGEPIPIPTRFNVKVTVYDVINLYKYDVMFMWDTEYVSYVSHEVLAKWKVKIGDEVNVTAGTYWVAYSRVYPDPPLPNGYDVADIDIPSILLNETIPAEPKPIAIGDYDRDTIADLMVKFNRTEVIRYVLLKRIKYGKVTLSVTGRLLDGTPFEGSYVIVVSALQGDVNCDGKVNINDLVMAARAFNSVEEGPRWNANFAPPWNRINIFDIVTIVYHYGRVINN